ncbi:MAG: acylphosphatase [Flavisolibacter sp.]
MPTFHLIIKGKVQGVFYRAEAKKQAEELGLTGWVRNTGEGHVEAFVSGPGSEVQAFIEWCRRGPSRAMVTAVTATVKEETVFKGFQILR